MKRLFTFFFDKSLLIFLIIGGLNTIISTLGSQFLLLPFTEMFSQDIAYWASTAIMFTLCSIASFYFNRKYSFESKAPLLKSAIRFSVVILVCYLIGFGFSDILTPIIINSVNISVSDEWLLRIAMLFGQVVFTGLNYIGQRLWAFKE